MKIKQNQGCKSRYHDMKSRSSSIRPLESNLTVASRAASRRCMIDVDRVQLSLLAHQGEVADSAFSRRPIALSYMSLKNLFSIKATMRGSVNGIPLCQPRGTNSNLCSTPSNACRMRSLLR
jgi:hypothetical protein